MKKVWYFIAAVATLSLFFFRNRILTILTFEGSKQTILSFLRIAHFYDGYLYCRSEQQEGVSHTN